MTFDLTPTRFTVSAAWMEACGLGSKARTFDVIRVEERVAPNPDYRVFYVLNRDGVEWTVLGFRGALALNSDYPTEAEFQRLEALCEQGAALEG